MSPAGGERGLAERGYVRLDGEPVAEVVADGERGTAAAGLVELDRRIVRVGFQLAEQGAGADVDPSVPSRERAGAEQERARGERHETVKAGGNALVEHGVGCRRRRSVAHDSS